MASAFCDDKSINDCTQGKHCVNKNNKHETRTLERAFIEIVPEGALDILHSCVENQSQRNQEQNKCPANTARVRDKHLRLLVEHDYQYCRN